MLNQGVGVWFLVKVKDFSLPNAHISSGAHSTRRTTGTWCYFVREKATDASD
jgi:hypothetical protein